MLSPLSFVFFCLLLSLSLWYDPALVSSMSLQVYNDPTCAAANLNLAWSINWPELGPAGNRTYLDCAINPLAVVPVTLSPLTTAQTNQTVAYWCSPLPRSTNLSTLLAYLYTAASPDCDQFPPLQEVQLMVNSFAAGQCTSISILNYTTGTYYPGMYAVVNCSAQLPDPEPLPSNHADSMLDAVAGPITALITTVSAVWIL